MNQIFNHSENERIIVISFKSISTSSNIDVFDLFASFKSFNSLNHWNLSLIQAVQNCILVGHIDPHILMIGGSENYLDIIKLAWMKQILKAPLGFTIQYLGELCNFLISKTHQCSSLELEEAICKCVCELINNGLPSDLKYIAHHVSKFIPRTENTTINYSETFLTMEMIKFTINCLQRKGFIYNTGHGYNVMTADKLRVAKWLDDLPDEGQFFSDLDNEQKKSMKSFQKTNSHAMLNREYFENVDDCHDNYGNKFNNEPLLDEYINMKETWNSRNDYFRNNHIDKILSKDSIFGKSRILCGNSFKKDILKRYPSSKYESSFINRIICEIKKIRIHWPSKNGVVKRSNIEIPEVCNKKNFTFYEHNVNVFNKENYNGSKDILTNIPNFINNNKNSQKFPINLTGNETFIPYVGTKQPSAVDGVGYYDTYHPKKNIQGSFVSIDEQRCCSELMLTGGSSLLTSNYYIIDPSKKLSGCNISPIFNATNSNYIPNDNIIIDKTVIPSKQNHLFSQFTCDSGFNSIRGLMLPENEISHSKTSTPLDIKFFNQKLSSYNCNEKHLDKELITSHVRTGSNILSQSQNYQSTHCQSVLEISKFIN